MPELPEVETVTRGLARFIEGETVTSVECLSKSLRYPIPQDLNVLVSDQLVSLTRRAKYMIWQWSSGRSLLVHLGMTGTFRVETDQQTMASGLDHAHIKRPQEKHDHVRLTWNTPQGQVITTYNDPRRFGFIIWLDAHAHEKHIAHLGLEPLSQLTPQTLYQALAPSKAPLKATLMDQTRIAGLGNIYVCESLFRAGLNPWEETSRALEPPQKRTALAQHIQDVLKEAILAGGSSLRDFQSAEGELGYFQHSFAVYGREGQPCHTNGCQARILREVQAGRSTFYCPHCQPPLRLINVSQTQRNAGHKT